MLKVGTVSSCLLLDLESGKLEIELHTRTLTGLTNNASEIIGIFLLIIFRNRKWRNRRIVNGM